MIHESIMADQDEDTKWCKNCKRDIAAVNFLMHEVHCQRKIVLCDHCQEPIPRTQIDEHFEQQHAPVQCDLCQVSVEREKLEVHKEGDCPKRMMLCAYCELELPQCDHKKHMDFCGTRTEMCVVCNSYVMHKDINRHEQSNCNYPSTTNNASSSSQNGTNTRSTVKLNNTRQTSTFHPQPYSYRSSFAVDELSRLLTDQTLSGASQAQGSTRSFIKPAKRNNTNAVSNPPGADNFTQSRTHNDIQGTTRRRVPMARKPTNNSSVKNHEKPQSYGRSMGLTGRGLDSYGHNLDMDHLLAMHLANEVDDGEIQADHREQNGPSVVHSVTGDVDVSKELALPCEFCDELIPVDALISHQSVCNTNPYQPSSMTSPEDDIDSDTILPNNSPSRIKPFDPSRPRPHIVDNLSYLAAHDKLAHAELSDLHLNPGLDEDHLLPCEFCDNLFPDDILIQHQAVCDLNQQFSHRDLSPPSHTSYSKPKPKSQPSRGQRSTLSPQTYPQRNKQHTENVSKDDNRNQRSLQTKPVQRPQRANYPSGGQSYLSHGRRQDDMYDEIPAARRQDRQRLDQVLTDPTNRTGLDLPRNPTQSSPGVTGSRRLGQERTHDNDVHQHSAIGVSGTSYSNKRKPNTRHNQPRNTEANHTEQSRNVPRGSQSVRGRGATETSSQSRRPPRSTKYPNGDV